MHLHKGHCHSELLKELGCHLADEHATVTTTKMNVAKVLNVLSIHGYRTISTCSSAAGTVWTMGRKMCVAGHHWLTTHGVDTFTHFRGLEEHDWRRHNQETVHSWY